MRITKIRLQNLNSLVGEWEVDLTADDFTADGIFAIIGPTGAGKSTILDAICLALYGRTPRLRVVNQGSNEIMSRTTGDCFAEVEFTTAQGRFRSFWSQHRAYKLPTGELRPAKHEVFDIDADELLGEKIRDSAEEVERVTGMDFERFTRSMLLAQGDFSKFLNASPDERAPILEKITGTAIYSDISKHVHELYAQKGKELEAAQQRLQGITVLSEAAEAQLRADVATAEAAVRAREAQVSGLAAAVAWWERIDELTAQLDRVAADEVTLAKDVADFAPQKLRLRWARAALELDADHRELQGLRDSQSRDMQELAAKQGDVTGKQAAVEAAEMAQQASTQALGLAQQEVAKTAPLLVQVRQLDTAIGEKQKPIATATADLERKHKDRQALHDMMAAAAEELAAKEVARSELRGLLERTRADAELVGDYVAIKERLDALAGLREKMRRTRRDVAGAQEKLAAATSDAKKAHEVVGERQRAADEAQQVLSRAESEQADLLAGVTLADLRKRREELLQRRDLLKTAVETGAELAKVNEEVASLAVRDEEIRTAITAVEQQQSATSDEEQALSDEVVRLEERVRLLQQIGSFEEARRDLHDGAECPLCGSLDHPYARGNVPEPSAAERDLQQAKLAYAAAHKQRQELDVRLAGLQRDVVANNDRQAAKAVERNELRGRLVQKCQRLGLDGLAADDADEAHNARLSDLHGDAAKLYTEIADTIKLAEAIDDQIKSARDGVDRAAEVLAAAGRSAHEAQLAETLLATTLSGLETDVAAAEREGQAAFDRLAESLERYGVDPVALSEAADLGVVAVDLHKRREAWMQREQEVRDLEQAIGEMTTIASQRTASITTMTDAIEAAEQQLSQLREDLETARRQRQELFGEQDPGAEETRLNAAVDAAQLSLRNAEAASGTARNDLDQLTKRIAELDAAVAVRAEALRASEDTFAHRLADSKFDDEAAFVQASMPAAERQGLEVADRELVERQSALDARRRHAERELVDERAKAVTTVSVDELRLNLEAAKAAKSEADQQVGALGQQLVDNDEAKRKSAGAMDAVVEREREYRRWGDLHALIGSNDGKKYRNFVQGLTFEIMINHANRQLRRMSDRYLLIHDEHHPLQLNVVDDYQASEVRSTKNLSGGESFIVSLALALGLSQMASRNVRVDSLFLDEGFGTLDEEALDSALTTLSSLQQDGKMIGIISHVGALKERIRAQIVVTPQAGGKSVLSGPGCSRT